LQRRFARRQQQLALAGLGLHGGHVQAGAHQAGPHQGIEPRHQGLAGAAVFGEAVAGAGRRRRLAIGGQFAAAEAVDRLLGIAHHHQQVLRAGAGEGLLQDAPLDRVGVLEFIDQGGAVALGHGRQQRRLTALRIRAWIERFEQLTETHLAAAFAPAGQLAAATMGEVQQRQFRRPIHQRGDRLHQWTLRQ